MSSNSVMLAAAAAAAYLLSLLLLFFAGNAVAAVVSTEFDFGTLSLTSLKLLGDAHINNGTVRLTRDLPVPDSGSGRALYSRPVTFRRKGSRNPASFSTFFSFCVTNLNPSSIGGGLAFVIVPDDQTVGGAGGMLGLATAAPSPPTAFVAVEFDTLMDVGFKDINGNHVGLDLNSMVSAGVGDLEAQAIDLKSGDLVNAWVEYDGSTRGLNVFVSYSNLKPAVPLLALDLDLGQYVNDLMYVGFSGSTQGSTEIHTVEWWSFRSSLDTGGPDNTTAAPPPHPSTFPPPTPPTPSSSADSPAPSNSLPATVSHSHSHSHSSGGGSSKLSHSPGAVAGVVSAGAFALAVCAGALIWAFSKKSRLLLLKGPGHGRPDPSLLASEMMRMPKEFGYKELKYATKGFDSNRIIGHGAFGTVYTGVLPGTGDIVAVKRCSHSGAQGRSEFLSELSIIGTLRHRNLVRLQGWCHEKGEILLVYDLMLNGSLDKALFEGRSPLPWAHRLKILVGVASALAYLHQECENQVIHRDVKASNIMLDEEFNARLGDFGLAREVEHDKSPDATAAAGTMGYLAPEYLLTGRAGEKTDVFSYGAVALEVATGRRPIEKETVGVGKTAGNGGGNLVDWVWGLYREGRVVAAADGRLGGAFDESEMRRVLMVGLACSHPDPLARPTMRTVIQMLVGEVEVPVVPRSKPSASFSTSQLLLNLQDSVSDCNGLIAISTSSSDHSFNMRHLL